MAKIDTLFMAKTAENLTLWGHTYLYSPYKGVPPRRDLTYMYVQLGTESDLTSTVKIDGNILQF